nr:hypothetical protein OG365_38820 [Streptomyces sp. NBC_00853]
MNRNAVLPGAAAVPRTRPAALLAYGEASQRGEELVPLLGGQRRRPALLQVPTATSPSA